jgi:hypothetical protein
MELTPWAFLFILQLLRPSFTSTTSGLTSAAQLKYKAHPTAVFNSYPHIFRSRMHQGWFAFIAPSASSGTYFIERRMLICWWVGNEKLKRSIATD